MCACFPCVPDDDVTRDVLCDSHFRLCASPIWTFATAVCCRGKHGNGVGRTSATKLTAATLLRRTSSVRNKPGRGKTRCCDQKLQPVLSRAVTSLAYSRSPTPIPPKRRFRRDVGVNRILRLSPTWSRRQLPPPPQLAWGGDAELLVLCVCTGRNNGGEGWRLLRVRRGLREGERRQQAHQEGQRFCCCRVLCQSGVLWCV